MKYLIWTFNYRHDRGGSKVLHRLCHELTEAGQEAYVGCPVTNPEWNESYREPPLDGDWMAVYPEVVSGNPWNAPRVARWVLNVPGHLGGDKVYDPAELVFSWSPIFLEGVPLLHIPAIETDIYTDRRLARRGAMFYVGKGRETRRLNARPVTTRMRLDRYALADALNRATVLYSFDDTTAMAQIALLCGCPVVVIPTGERLNPTPDFREKYLALWPVFREQLATFIEITQEA